MSDAVDPIEIAAAVRLPTTTVEEAGRLIQAYAAVYASGAVIKALEQQHHRTMAILRVPS